MSSIPVAGFENLLEWIRLFDQCGYAGKYVLHYGLRNTLDVSAASRLPGDRASLMAKHNALGLSACTTE